MDKEDVNKVAEQAKSFAKAQAQNVFSVFLGTLKKAFVFKGRATRFEFWTFAIAYLLINFVVGLLSCIFVEEVQEFFMYLLLFVDVVLLVPYIAVTVRRMHDLGLSGFWVLYLTPIGVAVVFLVCILDLDPSCNKIMDRMTKLCNNWVAWILLPIFWYIAAYIAMFLLLLYKGKEEENEFGPSPYAK